MDSSAYRHLLSKIKKSNAVPHHNFPSHNLLSVENLLDVSVNLNAVAPESDTQFLSSIPCYQKFPYAISRSSPCFCGSGITDDAYELVRKKLKWQRDLKNLKIHDVDKAIKQIKDLQQDKTTKLSKNLSKYVNHLYRDPEPMFYGNYNWLYSCGTLSYTEAFDGAILISADTFGKKPGFNVLKLNENLDEVYNKYSSTLKTFSPVLQTTCKSKQDSLIICVRQKNYLNLYSISKAECLSQPVKLWSKKVTPPKLITCADIKPNCEEVLLSDSNHDLHVFHAEQKNKIYGYAGRKIFSDLDRDPWSQVAFGDLGLYVAFRNGFAILDPRDIRSGTKFKYTPSFAVNSCEDICSFVKSLCDSNFIYMGTTHSILQLDVRNGETVQKWTHLMKKPPQFITGTKDGQENEILMLQSQDAGEILGIANESLRDDNKMNFISRSLPCLLSSIKESLKVAHSHGVCLSPSLTERINFVVTGMQCMKNSAGDINMFINNSGGDVFVSSMKKVQAIHCSREEDERHIVKSMKVYESQLQNFHLKESKSPHLELTDMSHVLKDLRESKSRPKERTKPDFYWKYHEMYSPENLELCKDLLAQKILRVWGYGAEEFGVGDTTVSVDDKVREWMCKN